MSEIFNPAAPNSDESYSYTNFRVKRMAYFLSILEKLPKPVTILDVGGEEEFWKDSGLLNNLDVTFTMLNLYEKEVKAMNNTYVAGNGTSMPEFADKSFDIVFSNSVIEHVFNWENQQKMASEIRRIGKNYFVQTPNLYFPMEPHFRFFFWQFLPREIRVRMLQKKRIGYLGPCPIRIDSEVQVDEFQLLSIKQMKQLFPEARIELEKFKGLTKSIMAIQGFGE